MLDFKNSYNLNFVPKMKGLVVFLHGLTSSKEEGVLVFAENFLNGKNYSTFRFNFYGDGENETSLKEENLQNHIDDANKVVDYFHQQGIKNIILIGHSFGGLVGIYTDTSKVSSIILWDASLGGSELLDDIFQEEDGQYYVDRGDGYKHYIGDQMFSDCTISPGQHTRQIASLKLPIKIIAAEHGLVEQSKEYFASASNTKDLTIISDADHMFSQENTKKNLLKETLEWIEKI